MHSAQSVEPKAITFQIQTCQGAITIMVATSPTIEQQQ
jgi:hypothetical protein